MKVMRRALHEPVALSATVVGGLNVAAAFGMLHLTSEQLSVLNVAMASALGFLARTVVTPVVRPRDRHRRPLAAHGAAPGADLPATALAGARPGTA